MANSRISRWLIWASISVMGLGIMKLLLVVLASLSVSQPLDTKDIEKFMRFPGMEDVQVVWQNCGEDNAYWDRRKTVIMCNELRDNPEGQQRFYLAHEFAHAIIDRLDIPYTGSEETAADELATITLLMMGMEDDVVTMETVFTERARPYLDPTDPHLHSLQRAHNLGCLRLGRYGWPFDGCDWKWRDTVINWSKLLSKSHVAI